MRRADQPKGLPAVLAGVKHGSHICAFYETHDDLIDLVLAFLTSRVNRGELCLWMMPDGVSDEARVRTNATLAERGIESHRACDLYQKPHFESGPVTRFWNEKLQEALVKGHSGMCASGDTFWLQPREWKTFLDYEAGLNNAIADKPITLLCTYPLSVSKAGDILDVARAHQVALSKRQNTWEVIKAWGPPGQQPRLARSVLTHWMRPSGFRCSASVCSRCLMRSRKGGSARSSLAPWASASGRLNYIVLVCWTGLVSAPLRKRSDF